MAWSVLRGIFKPETYFGAQAEDEGNKRRTVRSHEKVVLLIFLLFKRQLWKL